MRQPKSGKVKGGEGAKRMRFSSGECEVRKKNVHYPESHNVTTTHD